MEGNEWTDRECLVTTKPRSGLRVGDRPVLEIDEMVVGGEALGRVDGLPVFVPFGVPGDRLTARIISTKPGYARGLIDTLESAGSARTTPPCEVFGECGGCQWQMLSPEAQGHWKTEIVRQSLKRVAGIAPEGLVSDCLPSPEVWHYRNKVHWAVSYEASRWTLGLYAERSHRVVTAQACAIQHPALTAAQHALEKSLSELQILPYDEKRGTGWLRSAFAKIGHRSGQLMVGLVSHQAHFPQAEIFVAKLRAALPGLHTVVQNIHSRPGNKLMGPDTRVLDGPGVIQENLTVAPGRPPLELSISPVSFFQVNGAAVELLYDTVARACGLPPEGPGADPPAIIDAFSGTGAIALFLAARGAAHVTGVEVIAPATADAERNAALNGLEAKATFITGTVEANLGHLLGQGTTHPVVVLDPPRKGCEPGVLTALNQHRPKRVVYVSCNPATLARDLKHLQSGGYQIETVQPVDMFPQTSHVECVVSLRHQDVAEG